MEWNDAKETLPIPEELNEPNAEYYLVRVVGYGHTQAMYLKDEEGNVDWYTSYISKIVRPIIRWMKLEW